MFGEWQCSIYSTSDCTRGSASAIASARVGLLASGIMPWFGRIAAPWSPFRCLLLLLQFVSRHLHRVLVLRCRSLGCFGRLCPALSHPGTLLRHCMYRRRLRSTSLSLLRLYWRRSILIVLQLRAVNIRVLSEAILHRLEVFNAVHPLRLLLREDKTAKCRAELLPARTMRHPTETRAVPVDFASLLVECPLFSRFFLQSFWRSRRHLFCVRLCRRRRPRCWCR